jgi:hypothetical protein
MPTSSSKPESRLHAKIAGKPQGMCAADVIVAMMLALGGVHHLSFAGQASEAVTNQGAASAQASGDAQQAWTVDRAWALIRGYYAGGPREESATLEVGDGASARREVIRVGLDASQSPPRIMLEFGGFRVAGAHGQVTAIHADAPGRYASGRVTSAEDLLAFMPGLPVPQIAAALGAAANSAAAREFVLGARFIEVIEDGAGDARRVVLRGGSNAGPAEIVADAASGRVLSMSGVVANEATDALPVRVSFEVIAPRGELPDGWELDVSGRRRVESITLLKPGPRAISAGDSLRALALSAGVEMQPFSIVDEHVRARAAAGGEVGVALVVFKPGAAADDAEQVTTLAAAAAKLVEARRLVRADDADRVADVLPIFVGVMPIAEFSRERVEAFEKRWKDATRQAGVGGERLWPRVVWAIGGGPLETLISRGKTGENWVVVAGDDVVVRYAGALADVLHEPRDARDNSALARTIVGWITGAERDANAGASGEGASKR